MRQLKTIAYTIPLCLSLDAYVIASDTVVPTDVWNKTAQELEKKDLKEFGLTCKTFAECANRARSNQAIHLKASQLTDENVNKLKLYGQIKIKIDTAKDPDSYKEVGQLDEPTMKRISQLTNLKELNLGSTPIDDKLLSYLSNLPNLENLTLYCKKITPEGLAAIGKLTNLKELELLSSSLPENALVNIEGLTNLKTLSVASPVSDVGFAHISKLSNLESLMLPHVYFDDITPTGVEELKKLKHLKIINVIGPRGGQISRVDPRLPNVTILRAWYY